MKQEVMYDFPSIEEEESGDNHCITLGELKKVIDLAVQELGPDIKCRMSYDSTAGYDLIGSAYLEEFWDGDAFVLSCASKESCSDDIKRKAKRLFGIK